MTAHDKRSLMSLLWLSCFVSLPRPCHLEDSNFWLKFFENSLSRLRFIRHNSTPSLQLSIAAHFFNVCKSHRPCPKGLVHSPHLKHILITLNMTSLSNMWNMPLQELMMTPVNILGSVCLPIPRYGPHSPCINNYLSPEILGTCS